MTDFVSRFMGVSAIKRGQEEVFLRAFADGRVELRSLLKQMGAVACSIFRQGQYVFLYVELSPEERSKAEDGLDAERLRAEGLWSGEVKRYLEAWPSLHGEEERLVLRMNDIFHDDRPMGDVPWRRPDWQPTRRTGKLAQLKPDMYGSYVYLHYQLQEEQPRLFSKYYTIGSFGPFIFSYEELPALREPARKGLLDSKQTPADWPGAMYPHFEPWPGLAEEERLWRELEALFHLGEQD